MQRYLLSIYQPDGPIPPADALDKVMRRVEALNAEMKSAGAWVFAGGLEMPDTATTVKVTDGEVTTTDGPFSEAKEQIGGFWVIRCADLDAALEWARKGSAACRGAVEVRPFQDEAED